jgi:hypothetical protein
MATSVHVNAEAYATGVQGDAFQNDAFQLGQSLLEITDQVTLILINEHGDIVGTLRLTDRQTAENLHLTLTDVLAVWPT